MSRPIIALLTDFGLRDHYVGTMKGVALGICPDAALVDISHDLPPHDVLAAALELDAAYRYFPAGTIFLAVVDPGVGSARRAIAIDAADYRFGNLITNIDQAVLDRLGEPITVDVSGRTLPRLVGTYADVAAGAICALIGSSGHLEIALNGGSAAEALGAARGTAVHLRRSA